MIDVKVSLSIELPGSQMLSKEECLKTIQKEFTVKQGKNKGKTYLREVEVDDWDKMESHFFFTEPDKKKGIKAERINFHTRKSIPARQHTNICSDAYYNMISADACPEWSKMFIWKKLSKKARLEAHLDKIAESFGGKVMGYHVFDD